MGRRRRIMRQSRCRSGAKCRDGPSRLESHGMVGAARPADCALSGSDLLSGVEKFALTRKNFAFLESMGIFPHAARHFRPDLSVLTAATGTPATPEEIYLQRLAPLTAVACRSTRSPNLSQEDLFAPLGFPRTFLGESPPDWTSPPALRYRPLRDPRASRSETIECRCMHRS